MASSNPDPAALQAVEARGWHYNSIMTLLLSIFSG
jgi:hypothetical protein